MPQRKLFQNFTSCVSQTPESAKSQGLKRDLCWGSMQPLEKNQPQPKSPSGKISTHPQKDFFPSWCPLSLNKDSKAISDLLSVISVRFMKKRQLIVSDESASGCQEVCAIGGNCGTLLPTTDLSVSLIHFSHPFLCKWSTSGIYDGAAISSSPRFPGPAWIRVWSLEDEEERRISVSAVLFVSRPGEPHHQTVINSFLTLWETNTSLLRWRKICFWSFPRGMQSRAQMRFGRRPGKQKSWKSLMFMGNKTFLVLCCARAFLHTNSHWSEQKESRSLWCGHLCEKKQNQFCITELGVVMCVCVKVCLWVCVCEWTECGCVIWYPLIYEWNTRHRTSFLCSLKPENVCSLFLHPYENGTFQQDPYLFFDKSLCHTKEHIWILVRVVSCLKYSGNILANRLNFCAYFCHVRDKNNIKYNWCSWVYDKHTDVHTGCTGKTFQNPRLSRQVSNIWCMTIVICWINMNLQSVLLQSSLRPLGYVENSDNFLSNFEQRYQADGKIWTARFCLVSHLWQKFLLWKRVSVSSVTLLWDLAFCIQKLTLVLLPIPVFVFRCMEIQKSDSFHLPIPVLLSVSRRFRQEKQFAFCSSVHSMASVSSSWFLMLSNFTQSIVSISIFMCIACSMILGPTWCFFGDEHEGEATWFLTMRMRIFLVLSSPQL